MPAIHELNGRGSFAPVVARNRLRRGTIGPLVFIAEGYPDVLLRCEGPVGFVPYEHDMPAAGLDQRGIDHVEAVIKEIGGVPLSFQSVHGLGELNAEV